MIFFFSRPGNQVCRVFLDLDIVTVFSQIPPEVFRLGKTRVFFKAGQILALQKILNEARVDKGAWVLQRLEDALGNRRKANAAAEEAQVCICIIDPNLLVLESLLA